MRLLITVLVCLSLPAFAAGEAESKKSELKKVEQAQKAKEAEGKKLAAASAQIKSEVLKLKEKLVAVSNRLEEHEQKRRELQEELIKIMAQERALSAERAANQKDLSEVVAIVLRLSRLPPEAMIFSPTPPQQTIYTTLGMQTVMSELNRRVAIARQQLGDLASVREKLREQQQAIATAEQKIASDRAELSDLMRQRETARRQTDAQRAAAEQAAKTLAARASDLRDLIQQLRARKNKQARPTARMALVAAGSARAPISGNITRPYGVVDSVGNRSRGITLAGAPKAVVVAPRAGQVVFAGSFRSYGQVVIIEVADGQHILLTGLGDIDVSEGENLRTGEPVGHMPDSASALYIETRKDGEPVDPATFGLSSKT